MPRLSSFILRHAKACNTHLPRLLRECRDVESASNELRWLAEYANSRAKHANHTSGAARLTRYVRRRSRGEPLQYILGNQPFGELDILCRKNVLIPRPETELYTIAIAKLLNALRSRGIIDKNQRLGIADLCTGTGCIALLLHALLRSAVTSDARHAQLVDIFGVDLSSHALRLARDNLRHNLENGLLNENSQHEIVFEHLDVLKLGGIARGVTAVNASRAEEHDHMTNFMRSTWDVIVSNPPYISPTDYAPGGTVSRSVRDYEPKLALVPPPLSTRTTTKYIHQADQFYEAALHIARKVQTKLLVMEVGDSNQARRVRELAAEVMPREALIETWRDDGSVDLHDPLPNLQNLSYGVDIAHERVVAVWTGAWKKWRAESM